MTSASFEFLVFSLVAAAVFNLSRAVAWRQFILLLTSVGFLIWISPSIGTLIPLFAFLTIGFAGVHAMRNPRMRRALPVFVGIVIAAFVWLKKYSFVPSALLLKQTYVTIGLSYIFFRVLHLIIDAAQDTLPEKPGAVSFLNYMLNFTTLVSGPIQRYQDFSKMQLAAVPLPLDIMTAGRAIERIIVGFFKVNVLSMLFSTEQKHTLAFLSPADPFSLRLLHGVAAFASYPLFLYCNFSGYIDIVIGIAVFLRLRLPENFDRPFSSDNFINFWSRWHITLSQWLKTYVYNPIAIAGMRRFQGRSTEPFVGVFAFFVTFFLIGLWHGPTSEFLFFGVLQGAGVSGTKLFQIFMAKRLGRKRYKALAANPIYNAFARGLTFTWFAFTLVWFWSTWRQIAFMSRALTPGALVAAWLAIFLCSTVVLAAWESIRSGLLSIRWDDAPLLLSRYTRTVWNTALLTITVAIMLLLHSPAPDLVYKSF